VHLLTDQDGQPVTVINQGGSSAILLVCEHASRRLPEKLGTLGLDDEALTAHIAWDPGALAVSRLISESMDAALIQQNFSRLAYDCNRPPDAPDAMPQVSEIYDIPGNRDLNDEARQARIEEIYRPFEGALAREIETRAKGGRRTVIVTMHTFTPVYKGVARDVEIGVLHDEDSRLADEMLARADARYVVRRNEPYGPVDGVTHTLKRHGLENGLVNVMIEIRNDLVRDEAGQARAAGFLSGLLGESLAALG
jgi:predicted N-formylglutamate amidohydrolase